MKRIKTLKSYVAHHKFLAECNDSEFYWMPRKLCPVKTPFSCGPTVAIFHHPKLDYVWIAETSHRNYEVWSVSQENLFNSEVDAENEEFNSSNPQPRGASV